MDDEVKLLDFGIATEAPKESSFAGTIDYMAPELMLGAAPSIQSDLYAVGIVFYQMLTGSLPMSHISMTSMFNGLLDDDFDSTLCTDVCQLWDSMPRNRSIPWNKLRAPSPLTASEDEDAASEETPTGLQLLGDASPLWDGIPGALGVVVSKLLARDPEQRYENASMALRELAAAVPYDLPVETSATRESFLQATVLVGREKEIGKLEQGLEHAKQRRGEIILIGGESGVGKSRLLSEVRTLALVYGFWVAEGQAVTEGGQYYQEWLPLLRALCFRVDVTDAEAAVLKDLLPNIALLLDRPIPEPPGATPEAALARLNKTILGLLKRLTKPLLLILEDLHSGRSESLTLLAELGKAASEFPVLLVGSYRSDESAHLPATLPGSAVIPLSRLPQHDIAKLSVSMLGPVGQQPELLAYLTRQAEGNVFFLIEVVRALAENVGELDRIGQGELPESVLTAGIGRIIERRVDRVAAAYRPLLEFSATLGRQLDLAVLQQVFPRSPIRDFLLDCANAAVLESQGSDWRFAHDKLRETILRRIEPERRRSLHAQVAQAFERRYQEDERAPFAAILGFHYREAGIPDKAILYYLQAGDRATRVYAYEQARAHFALCAQLVTQLPETLELKRLRTEILIKQVQCSLSATPADVNPVWTAPAGS